jgi:hypothetical protein
MLFIEKREDIIYQGRELFVNRGGRDSSSRSWSLREGAVLQGREGAIHQGRDNVLQMLFIKEGGRTLLTKGGRDTLY